MRLVNHPGRIPSPKLLAMLPRAVASLFIITLMVPSAVYADLVYNVTPYRLDPGFSIDGGSIAVSDSAVNDGRLRADEIGRFTFFGTGPTGLWSFSNTTVPQFRVGFSDVRIDQNSLTIIPGAFFGLRVVNDVPSLGDELIYEGFFTSQPVAIELQTEGARARRTFGFDCFPGGGGCLPNRVVVATRSAIPEPSPVPLMGLVTAGLFGYRRRKRKLANVKS